MVFSRRSGVRSVLALFAVFAAFALACASGNPSGVGTTPTRSSAAPLASAPPPPTLPRDWPYQTPREPVTSTKGMVVSDAALATQVGADILAAGGTAGGAAA